MLVMAHVLMLLLLGAQGLQGGAMAGSDGGQHGGRLGAGLVRFGLGLGVIDHPGTGLYVGHAVFHESGADDDAGIHLAGTVDVADRAAVAAAALAFHHANKLAGADLGAPVRVPMFMQA